jgi:hypothetical protein
VTENFFPDFAAACRFLEHIRAERGFRRYDSWPTENHQTGWKLTDDPREFVRRVFDLRDHAARPIDDRHRALIVYAEGLAVELDAKDKGAANVAAT